MFAQALERTNKASETEKDLKAKLDASELRLAALEADRLGYQG